MANKLGVAKIFGISLLLFALIFPFSNNLTFKQTDDWIYYKQVKKLGNGSYKLDDYIEATFYTQGFMGVAFSKAFSSSKLPVLTLIVSIANFFIFTLLIYNFYGKRVKEALLVGLLLFFLPLHIFSMLGFMTDNYFILFLLLTFYFVEGFNRTNSKIHFAFLNVFAILGFFSRQLSIVSLIATIVYLFIQKRYKYAVLQLIITLGLLGYYYFWFTRTDGMVTNQPLQFAQLFNVPETLSLFYNILLFVAYYSLPLIFATFKSKSKEVYVAVLLAVFSAFIKTSNLLPLDSNMQRGFFTGDAMGLKYAIYGETIIYTVWRVLGVLGMGLAAITIFFKRSRFVNFYSVYMILYGGLLLVMLFTRDRYLMPIFPAFFIFWVSLFEDFKLSTVGTYIFGFFLLLLGLYSYNYGMDFYLINQKVWDYANNFAEKHHVAKTDISAGYGWRRVYNNGTNKYKYLFSFKEQKSDPELSCCYNLIDTINIEYPLNFFVNPKVYFYNKTK